MQDADHLYYGNELKVRGCPHPLLDVLLFLFIIIIMTPAVFQTHEEAFPLLRPVKGRVPVFAGRLLFTGTRFVQRMLSMVRFLSSWPVVREGISSESLNIFTATATLSVQECCNVVYPFTKRGNLTYACASQLINQATHSHPHSGAYYRS